MFHRKWGILSQTVFSLFYRFFLWLLAKALIECQLLIMPMHVLSEKRQLRVRSRDLTNILETDKVQNEYRLKRQNRVNNHLETILTSKIFECLICKSIQFKETRFVKSSGAENYVTLYNTSVRSNKSLKIKIKLKLYWGSSLFNKSQPRCTQVWRSALNTAVFFFPLLVSVIPIIAHQIISMNVLYPFERKSSISHL